MNVLVLGASGFIGGHLRRALERRGDAVVAASLRDPAAAANAAARCDAIVNLSGEPIGRRWDEARKHAILYSRTELPRRFLEALANLEPATPRTYVSASAIGYYGTSESETFVEENPPGADFLAQVCEAWERQASAARELGLRVAIVRTGLVLGNDGGVLARMLPPFRLGLGGIIGDGRQWYSWIHIEDLIGIYLSVLDAGDGPYNATAPNPVTNAEFTQTLGCVLHRPAVLPTPTFALQRMRGEGASVATTGQRVLPKRVTGEREYSFLFPVLEGALRNLLD
ncbi:MAG: TIGR01777 family oxidoreductase [Candidatus Eremiobacteraeota bacterium]|nr:TIGR01777 family oxidoreductase [Candidatus Eremiobacteraeota bacterium]